MTTHCQSYLWLSNSKRSTFFLNLLFRLAHFEGRQNKIWVLVQDRFSQFQILEVKTRSVWARNYLLKHLYYNVFPSFLFEKWDKQTLVSYQADVVAKQEVMANKNISVIVINLKCVNFYLSSVTIVIITYINYNIKSIIFSKKINSVRNYAAVKYKFICKGLHTTLGLNG